MKYWGGNWDVSFLWYKMAKMTCFVIIITMKMSVFKTEIADRYTYTGIIIIMYMYAKRKVAFGKQDPHLYLRFLCDESFKGEIS